MSSRPRRSGYVPQEIEPKWQKIWAERGVMKASDSSPKPKFYDLVMYPYPSGELHMGHARNYVMGDALARMKRMQGFEVLHPFGWDAFGLPAENAAMKHPGLHPQQWTLDNIVESKRDLKMMGILYDWDREVTSCMPDYYRWTQWLFLLMYERGLAYRAMAPVNWCPVDKTVLANEQVINGRCWRHPDVEVEKRDLEQWFLKITDYAERLLDDIALLDRWPQKVRVMQTNWIGRSMGAEVDFPVDGMPGESIRICPGVCGEGTQGDRDRAPLHGAGEDRGPHRWLRDQPDQWREDPDLGRRLRAGDVRHRGDHGRAGAR